MSDTQQCAGCAADPQPENFASPRKCAFGPDGIFKRNWNCVTLNRLADIAEERGLSRRDYDESIQIIYCGDEIGGWIVLTRYKERGECSSAIHVGDFYPPRTVTLTLALQVLGDIPVEDSEVPACAECGMPATAQSHETYDPGFHDFVAGTSDE